jgi:1,4-dihydroxy-2-naphthoate octaprenyltransferase
MDPFRVLVIDAHPRKDSYCRALAEAVHAGAMQAGLPSELLALRDLEFSLHPCREVEADLLAARDQILRTRHLVFVYPTWWGTMPALLKGFLDRIFTPGFAFEEREGGGWRGLLDTRSASLLTTMDTPPWIYRWLIGAPGHRALGTATLKFCGISPVRTIEFGPMLHSSADQRSSWLERARRHGERLHHQVSSGWRPKLAAWIAAARLPFYPMPWIAYTVGTLAAMAWLNRPVDLKLYLLGLPIVALIEFATVIRNELGDLPSDRLNKNGGPFTGGSRVLATKRLTIPELRTGLYGALALLALPIAAVTILSGRWAAAAIALVGLILGLGYTAPPIKASYRGLGELDVALTHSVVAIIAGYVLQGGSVIDPSPWLLALPLFFAVLPSITLAGFPDRLADTQAGKRTLVVRLGVKGAAAFAIAATLTAAILPLVLDQIGPLADIFGAAPFIMIPHALLLAALILRQSHQPTCRPINLLLAISLAYMIWPALFPLLSLLAGRIPTP